MIAQLSVSERQIASVIAAAVAITGAAMASFGRSDVLGIHGLIVMFLAVGLLYFILFSFDEPEPTEDRDASYYDDPIKVGIALSMAWAVFGMFMGVWVAAQLAWPDLAFDAGWSSFGRLRPTHTTGVIFGFGGNALIATSFHVVQRTSRARLAGQLSPWFVLFGYNLFCVLAVSGYLMGVTQSKEYAEAEWYADLWLVVVWVTYFVLYIRTIARRKEPHIYVANWYFMAFILVVAILHIVNNLAIPVSWGHAKSYTIWPGVQDAMVQWWYGHNAVAFFLTAGFLGMLYYYLPVRAQRPIFSYRLSILSFWGITFFYMWAGSHHLHYTALPHWVQTLGMTFSVMLLVPSWASAGNALLTLNGAWHRVRDDATLAFHDGGCGLLRAFDLRRLVLAIRPVNALSHYTDWTVGHVHAGALGWVALITFGSIYTLVPALWKRERMYSAALVEVHFWLAIAGTLIYVFAMWNSGIIQGLMWRTYTEDGRARLFVRRFAGGDVPLLHRARLRRPAVPARRGGRLLQHLDDGPRQCRSRRRARADMPVVACRRAGRMTECLNCSTASSSVPRSASSSRSSQPPASAASSRSRRSSPSHETVEDAPDMRLYTPLELAGRNIYIREGCYACHSQMIRTLRDEVERYGPYSLAVESKYDRPMLWGSKRTGPDLARIGGKYSDFWHVAHLTNPRDVVPESNMPAYRWLARTPLETDDLALHLAAQRALGVPYTDEMVENAARDAYGQATPDTDFAAGVTERYGEKTQVSAFDGVTTQRHRDGRAGRLSAGSRDG